MKRLKMAELLKKKPEELVAELAKLQAELNEVSVSFVNRKASDDVSVRIKNRKQIARIKTALSMVGIKGGESKQIINQVEKSKVKKGEKK